MLTRADSIYDSPLYPQRKRAVPAPTSEPLCKVKPLCARCTILHAISYIAKKAALLSREMRPFILKVNQPASGDFLLWRHGSPPLPECAPFPRSGSSFILLLALT